MNMSDKRKSKFNIFKHVIFLDIPQYFIGKLS